MIKHIVKRFTRNDDGAAAVEFSFILPIMVMLWLGGVEITHGLGVDRKVINLTSSVGDIASRSKRINESQITALFDLSEAAMFPQSNADTDVILSAVSIDELGNASVTWSRARGATAYTAGQPMNAKLPAVYRVPNSQMIIAEVTHPHRPAVGYRLTGTVQLEETMFFSPRLSTNVKLCDNNWSNCI